MPLVSWSSDLGRYSFLPGHASYNSGMDGSGHTSPYEESQHTGLVLTGGLTSEPGMMCMLIEVCPSLSLVSLVIVGSQKEVRWLW